MKNLLCLLAVFSCTALQADAQTLSWSGFPAGGTSYTTGIMTATITSSSPGFQNGAPKYYAGATVGGGECGIAGGLALEHMFGNITNAHSTLTMDYTSGGSTSGLCGNVSFQVRDINADESYQTFADWVEVWATDGNNNPIPVANITAAGGSNKTITTSGNTRIVKGYSNNAYGSRSSTLCDNITFTITPPAGTTLKSVTLKYHPDYTSSPGDYYNFTGPKRPAYQYISISAITITAAAGPTALSLTTTPSSCDQADGSVSVVSVTGGTSPYQFSFNGQGLSSATSYTGLAGGTYPITVRDNNGCSYSTSALVGVAAGPTAIAVSQTNAGCTVSNGSVTLGTVTGGTGPYEYNFNGGGFSPATSYMGLAAGTYPLVVKDDNGCTYATNVTVNAASGPSAVAASPVNAACGQGNGSITLGAVTGGSAPYEYNFNNGGYATNTTYGSLAAGTYPLAVRDNNGCIYNTAVTVGTTGGPTGLVITPVNASCGQANGAVVIGAVTGGTQPYQYQVNGGALSSATSYNDLPAGSYTVSVQDNNGCVYGSTIMIGMTSSPSWIAMTVSDASCGQPDGSVSLGAVTGGNPPYQYNFNGGGLSPVTSYTGLAAGTYPLVVRDVNGCTYNTTATVASSSGPMDILSTPSAASCGQSNGSVLLGAVTGGAAPYQYNFNGGGFSAATSYTNLAAGTYPLVVQDVNGCTYSTSVTVGNTGTPPSDIDYTVTDAACGQSIGTVALGVVTGGTAPYHYNFGGSGFSSSVNYTSLAAGTYPLIVEDAYGCSYSTNVTVADQAGPEAVNINTVDDACAQGTGSVTIGTVTGGTGPYEYSFNGSAFSPAGNYGNLEAGTYPIVVKDALGCTLPASAVIGGFPGPTAVSFNMSTETCSGANGVVTLGNVTGGTAPYQFNFNNLGFSQNVSYTGLTAGSYPLVVRDASGCQYGMTIPVSNLSAGPEDVAYSVSPAACGSGGIIEITAVTGGTAPYAYAHQGTQVGPVITGVGAGTYTLTVTDANGCTYDTDLLMPQEAGEEKLHIPNVFTPNGDPANATWFIGGGCLQKLECVILNRWGETMETFDEVSDQWDGTTGGKKAAPGVYFYKARVTFWSGRTEEYHGHITLIY